MTLVLSDLTSDFDDFASQFETYLTTKPVWKGTLTTQTSQTLIELVSAVGVFMQGRLVRAYEDAFAETAQSDDAIRAITQMQGLRLSRKLPAAIEGTITSPVTATLDPLTQFLVGGQYYFTRDQTDLVANVPLDITLFQGQIAAYGMSGLGTDNQTFLSEEDSFAVSDRDVQVLVNGVIIPKAFGNLWNYRNLPAYSDLTAADGRLLLVFGSAQFGTVPKITDNVIVRYPITQGEDGNNENLVGKTIAVDGFPAISGTVTANPTGGANEKPILAYKNLASGAFGTYESAVTKAQYGATVGVYPGIVDAFTQAQREINPAALEWMNVIRVSGLTSSPWTQQQKTDFCEFMQEVTMYAPRFLWVDPIPVLHNVSVSVFCFNSAVLSKVQADCELAIRNLFAPKPGLLMTNFYGSDLDRVCRMAGAGAVSYVIVNEPTVPMIVTAPLSPQLKFTLVSGAGELGTYMYAYGISTVNMDGEEGAPTNWVFPQVISPTDIYAIQLDWQPIPDTQTYKLWGRKAGQIGLIAEIDAADPLTFLDDGTIDPVGPPPNLIVNTPIRYNVLGDLTVTVAFAERQQRIDNSPTRRIV